MSNSTKPNRPRRITSPSRTVTSPRPTQTLEQLVSMRVAQLVSTVRTTDLRLGCSALDLDHEANQLPRLLAHFAEVVSLGLTAESSHEITELAGTYMAIYKRLIGRRGGRWQWLPPSFTESFSGSTHAALSDLRRGDFRAMTSDDVAREISGALGRVCLEMASGELPDPIDLVSYAAFTTAACHHFSAHQVI